MNTMFFEMKGVQQDMVLEFHNVPREIRVRLSHAEL